MAYVIRFSLYKFAACCWNWRSNCFLQFFFSVKISSFLRTVVLDDVLKKILVELTIKSPMTNVWRLLNPTIFLLLLLPLFDLKQTQTSPKVVGKRSMMFENKNKCINRHYSAVYREKIYQNKLQIAHKLFKLHQIFS